MDLSICWNKCPSMQVTMMAGTTKLSSSTIKGGRSWKVEIFDSRKKWRNQNKNSSNKHWPTWHSHRWHARAKCSSVTWTAPCAFGYDKILISWCLRTNCEGQHLYLRTCTSMWMYTQRLSPGTRYLVPGTRYYICISSKKWFHDQYVWLSTVFPATSVQFIEGTIETVIPKRFTSIHIDSLFLTMSSYQMPTKLSKQLQMLPGNNICVDCGRKDIPADWASVPFGIFMCLTCSGVHRGLGTHLSFVRSIKMDSWSEKQIESMRQGGNEKLNSYLEKNGIDRTTVIQKKYDNDVAQLYKLQVKARVEGEPEPTELIKSEKKTSQQNLNYQGFGSAPPPRRKRGNKFLQKLAIPAGIAVGAIFMWRNREKRETP